MSRCWNLSLSLRRHHFRRRPIIIPSPRKHWMKKLCSGLPRELWETRWVGRPVSAHLHMDRAQVAPSSVALTDTASESFATRSGHSMSHPPARTMACRSNPCFCGRLKFCVVRQPCNMAIPHLAGPLIPPAEVLQRCCPIVKSVALLNRGSTRSPPPGPTQDTSISNLASLF